MVALERSDCATWRAVSARGMVGWCICKCLVYSELYSHPIWMRVACELLGIQTLAEVDLLL